MKKDYCMICGTQLIGDEHIVCENCENNLEEPLDEPVRFRRRFLEDEESQ
jgi:hypothetical protein